MAAGKNKLSLCLVVYLLTGLLAPDFTLAASLETLVMPGKLIQGHAKYEQECSNCHQLFSKQSQSRLCLDCHEDVDADVRSEKGFHGRSGVGDQECKACHADHLGRTADIVPFSRETFDHEQTDYPLRGAHATVECAGCHATGKKYRAARQECFSCHEDDDVHHGNLGEACTDCHEVKGWKQHEFDHDETDYRLLGKHAEVACDGCHAGERYEGTPEACNDCHRFNDVHAGRFGAACDDCHSARGWKKITFDHDETDFRLQGRHRKVSCAGCHREGDFGRELPGDCHSCHRDVDKHKGNYGKQCDSCHGTDGWDKARFDHDANSDFPLRGRHEEVACNACHRGSAEQEELGKSCLDCHRSDDVHAGKQGEQCGSCHNESGWGEQVRFDHDLARFPLLGLHAVVPCEECHLSAVYTDASMQCVDCHADDDAHEERLGPRCADCHNPNGWALWEFDHDSSTDFRLDGGHAGIQCEACHRDPVRGRFRVLSSCDSCHRRDDVHDGRFGRYCERCHNTESFDQVTIRQVSRWLQT
jgi:hypothetical protein